MTEKNAKITIGIIGTGRIARRAVRELALVGELELAAVFNPNVEHAKGFVETVCSIVEIAPDEKICISNGETTLDEKICISNGETTLDEKMREEDSDGLGQKRNKILTPESFDEFLNAVDSVYIATPHGTHFEYARKALLTGKNVICEKPMALEKSQVHELCDIAKDKNLILMEAIKTEHCPGFKEIEEVIGSGFIGTVVDVEACFTRLTEGRCREFDDKKYGGAFTEFGSYPMLPIFRFLGTDPEEISFFSIPYETGVDGYTKAIFKYKNRIGTAGTGLTVKSEGQLVISGTKGYILVPSPWWLTKYFEVRFEDPSRIEKHSCEFEGDGLRYEFREFARKVRKRELTADVAMDEMIARADAFEKFFANNKQS